LKDFFRSIVTIISFIAAGALLLTVVSVYFNPYRVWILAIMGFGFPFLYVINFLLALVWLFRKRWQVFIPVLALVFTWGHWDDSFQMMSRTVDSPKVLVNPVSVMSFNVRMLDAYNWTGRKNVHEEIFQLIKKEKPDVVCLQEFYTSMTSKVFNENIILARFSQYPYRHVEYRKGKRSKRNFGLVTFSKYPIVARNCLKFDHTNNFSIQTDIVVNKTRVRVFNNHLESIGFGKEHMNFIDSLNYKNESERWTGIGQISSKIKDAFKQRAYQAERIGSHIKNSPYPTIVCGDFNDTPVSYVYRKMRGELNDAFVESGSGFGGTYNGRLPSLRIDYIFHDKRFKSYNFQRYKVDLSDHFPIVTLLDLTPQKL